MKVSITKDLAIEELIKACPQAVGLLIEEGLPCVVCGEPFWGTLDELARQKHWDDSKIEKLIEIIKGKCFSD
jgi:hypothetical protein